MTSMRNIAKHRSRHGTVAERWITVCALVGLSAAIGSHLLGADDEGADKERDASPASADDAAQSNESATVPIVRELPLEQRPYRVRVSLAVENRPEFGQSFAERLPQTVTARLQVRFGQMWNVVAESTNSWAPVSLDVLSRFDDEELNDAFLPTENDKVFLVGIARRHGAYAVFAREWDRNSRAAGPVLTRSTYDRRLVADVVSDLIHDLFRPIALATSVDDAGVDLLIRAGEYLTPDAASLPFREGDYLTTYFRYLNRQRELRQLQHVPWTYLRVDTVDRARLRCRVVSTFRRSPLGGARRRVELIGMRARPLFDHTALRMAPRGSTSIPMAGYRVDVMDRMPTADDAVEDRLSLTSSRRGVVEIPSFPEEPLRHLLVHSGKSVLARVPMIPGLEREMTLNPPSDRARLRVEGALAMLEGDLIDTVARRAVLMVRARTSANAGQWDQVDRFIAQLKSLPDHDRFESQITAIRTPAVETSRRLGDRVAAMRINRMCDDLQEVATEHLDPEKIRDFELEIAELKSLQ